MGDEIRVLHVDDEPDLCEVTALHLERAAPEMTVTTASTAAAGMTALDDGDVDCIVSDFDMPGMNGLEFLEAVRERDPELPFFLLTGKGSEEIASQAISEGVTGYLQKQTGTEQYEILANRIRNAVDRYRSKGALADSQQRLSLLIDQSPLAVIEWNCEFDVVRWNPAAEDVFGYDEDEILGAHVSELVPESERDHVDDIVDQLVANQGGHHSVNENLTKDGRRIVCEWHNRVVVDESEEVVSVFSLVRDVTDRQQRAAELERYETMVDTVVDGVYTLDETLHFTTVNEGMVDLTGYDRDQLVGSHISRVLEDGQIDFVRQRRQQTRESDSDTNTVTLVIETADGDTVDCEVRYRVRYADGEFVGTAGVFRPLDRR